MAATATIRELRFRFRKVKRLLEAAGEILVTEKGKPRYRLSLYSPLRAELPPAVDYWARLTGYQPKAITPAEAESLREELRGDR
jgi:hypothetical protein